MRNLFVVNNDSDIKSIKESKKGVRILPFKSVNLSFYFISSNY